MRYKCTPTLYSELNIEQIYRRKGSLYLLGGCLSHGAGFGPGRGSLPFTAGAVLMSVGCCNHSSPQQTLINSSCDSLVLFSLFFFKAKLAVSCTVLLP